MVREHLDDTLINKKGFGCIYCITNIINGMQYIGQTRREYINARWSEHKWNAKNYKNSLILYDAIREYGIENFEFSVIEFNVPVDELWDKEIQYISQYNTLIPNGYNISKGGGGTLGVEPWDKGIKRSEEDIEKIRKSFTPERRKQMSERMRGINNPMYGRCGEKNPMYRIRPYKKNGEEFHYIGLCGEKNPFYGKHHTEETRKKISELQKNKKKVAMKDPETDEVIQIFESLASSARYLKSNGYEKADDSAIGKCAKGRYKTVYGYKWQFIGE